jgi:hypothetical protein
VRNRTKVRNADPEVMVEEAVISPFKVLALLRDAKK